MPNIIYADLESLIKKTDGFANNPEKSSTTKTGEHIPCGNSISTIWAFEENKHSLCRIKNCMKNFCSSLREHAANVINFEKKKLLLLTKKELELHQYVTVCYICGKRFSKKFANDKSYQKDRHHCYFTGKYRGTAHSI